MKNHDIVCYSFDFWSSLWSRTQQLMFHISEKVGNKVLFINPRFNFPYYILHPKKAIRIFGVKNALTAILGKHTNFRNKIIIFTPIKMIPFSGRFKLLGRLENKIYTLRISKIITKYKLNNPILWINMPYLYSKSSNDLNLNFDLRVFDWTDDWLAFEKYERPEVYGKEDVGNERERYLQVLERADLVFTVAESLYSRAKRITPNTFLIPNGTDFENMSKSRQNDLPAVKKMEKIRSPRIGYAGWINNRIDLELIDYAIKRNSDLEFVFIGSIAPSFRAPDHIRNCPRVHFIGTVRYHQLPLYIRYMDVLIIPHYRDEVTNAENPIKLYDYLSTGKPIVTTNIAGVERFKDFIKVARDKEEFYQMIMQTLQEKDEGQIGLRMKAGETNSWRRRSEEVVNLLDRYINIQSKNINLARS